MVKNTEKKQEIDAIQPNQTKNRHLFFKTFSLIVVCMIGYGVWKNPALVQKMTNWVKTSSVQEENAYQRENMLYQQISLLQSQISQLQMQVNSLQQQSNSELDLSQVEDKISAIEQQNLNVINSKADVATVLGIVTRLDKIEEKLDTLAKISDDGALVLTATMMVRECADNGVNFVYEAEILNQLAKDDKDIQNDVATILRYANEGVMSQNELQTQFQKIYKNLLKVSEKQSLEGKSWKEKLNIKLSEVVKVKRVNDLAVPQSEQQDKNMFKKVKSLVDEGNLRQALDELHQMNNPVVTDNEILKVWMDKAQAKVNFNQAIANISAHSLALMKVNSLKNN